MVATPQNFLAPMVLLPFSEQHQRWAAATAAKVTCRPVTAVLVVAQEPTTAHQLQEPAPQAKAPTVARDEPTAAPLVAVVAQVARAEQEPEHTAQQLAVPQALEFPVQFPDLQSFMRQVVQAMRIQRLVLQEVLAEQQLAQAELPELAPVAVVAVVVQREERGKRLASVVTEL